MCPLGTRGTAGAKGSPWRKRVNQEGVRGKQVCLGVLPCAAWEEGPLGRAVWGSVEEGGLTQELAPGPPRYSERGGQLSELGRDVVRYMLQEGNCL